MNYIEILKVCFISGKTFKFLLDEWGKGVSVPTRLFLAKKDGSWITADNTSGEFYTEEFASFVDAWMWVKGT